MRVTTGSRGFGLAAVLVLAVGLASCNDDSSDSAGTDTTTTEAVAESTTTTAPPCEPTDIEVRRNDDDNWVLAATDPDGTERTAELAVEDRSAEVALRGGFDLDGDGLDEIFLSVGTGASTTVYAVASTAGCEPASIGFEGGRAAVFPVGSSVVNQNGLRCRPGELGAYSSTSDGSTFDWTLTTYALDGGVLTQTGSVSGTYPAGDPNVQALGALDCPGVEAG